MTAEKENKEVVFTLNIDGNDIEIYPRLRKPISPDEPPDPNYPISSLVMFTIHSMQHERSKLIRSIDYTGYGVRRKKKDATKQSQIVNPQIAEINKHIKVFKGELPGEIRTLRDSEGNIVGLTLNSLK